MTPTRRVLALGAPLVLLFAAPASRAADEASPFDGRWEITLSCPPFDAEDDDAKGYTHRFPGEVAGGVLRATHGTEGEPGWHLLSGPIAADGTAALRLEGIVSNPRYAINNAGQGKPYTYRVRARFESASGRGERLGKRPCDFRFQRR